MAQSGPNFASTVTDPGGGNGSWTNATAAQLGSDNAASAVWNKPAAAGQVSSVLRLSDFGTFTDVGSGDTINFVRITVNHFVSNTGRTLASQFELWDGTSAQIGETQTGTEATQAATTDTFDITGVTFSQLAALQARIRARGDTSNAQAATVSFDYLSLTVDYTASVTDLVIADADHTHSADGLALTQVHQLAVADSAHGHGADNAALAQIHTLAVADTAHAHGADNVDLGATPGAADLVIQDAAHTHGAGSATLTQAHTLAVADPGHGHSANGSILTQVHQLVLADAAQAHPADAPALTQVHSLVVIDTAHAHTADESQVNSATQLTAADAAHAHGADGLVLTQTHQLTVADSGLGHMVGWPGLTQVHELAVTSGVLAHAAAGINLGSSDEVDLVIQPAQYQHTADQIKLTTHLTPAPNVSTRAAAVVHVPGVSSQVAQRSGVA